MCARASGCRRSEILTLKWEYIDFERQCFRLPESKTGQKTIYLSPPALEVLTGIERNGDLVERHRLPTPQLVADKISKTTDKHCPKCGTLCSVSIARVGLGSRTSG